MSMRNFAALFFLLAAAVFLTGNWFVEAQSVEVIALDDDYARGIALAHAQLEQDQNIFDVLTKGVQGKYLMEERKDCMSLTASTYCIKKGWENGFEFSKDWKYILPKRLQMPSNGGGEFHLSPWIPGPGIFTPTPAYGSEYFETVPISNDGALAGKKKSKPAKAQECLPENSCNILQGLSSDWLDSHIWKPIADPNCVIIHTEYLPANSSSER
jgi:hypothetical protein